MVSVLASTAADRGVKLRSGQSKDYEIGICCFSAKRASLRRKTKDWLARNHDNVSERGDMSIRGLLFHWASTIKIQLRVLVWYKADLIIIIISRKINLVSPWYSWKFVELALNNNSPVFFSRQDQYFFQLMSLSIWVYVFEVPININYLLITMMLYIT